MGRNVLFFFSPVIRSPKSSLFEETKKDRKGEKKTPQLSHLRGKVNIYQVTFIGFGIA